MIFDRKRAVSTILSKMGKDGMQTETHVQPESGEHDAYTAHAEDMISAVKEGSVQRLAGMLKSYHGMIADADEAEDNKG